jgi:outer membrane lipoprotein-sorting protein
VLGGVPIPGLWVLALFLHPAIGQNPPDVADLLKKVSEKRGNLQQYKFTATVRFHDPGEGLDVSGSTIVAVQKPSKARWEIRGTVAQYFTGVNLDVQYIVDGKNVWTYVPKLNQYAKEQAPIDTASSSTVGSEMISHLEEIFLIRDFVRAAGQARVVREERIPFNGSTADCLVLESLDGPIDIHRWWIDRESYLVLRDEEESKENPKAAYYSLSIRFTTIQINGPVDQKVFVFSPPADARLVDRINP